MGQSYRANGQFNLNGEIDGDVGGNEFQEDKPFKS